MNNSSSPKIPESRGSENPSQIIQPETSVVPNIEIPQILPEEASSEAGGNKEIPIPNSKEVPTVSGNNIIEAKSAEDNTPVADQTEELSPAKVAIAAGLIDGDQVTLDDFSKLSDKLYE